MNITFIILRTAFSTRPCIDISQAGSAPNPVHYGQPHRHERDDDNRKSRSSHRQSHDKDDGCEDDLCHCEEVVAKSTHSFWERGQLRRRSQDLENSIQDRTGLESAMQQLRTICKLASLHTQTLLTHENE